MQKLMQDENVLSMMEKLKESFSNGADLDPRMVPFVETMDSGMKVLRHPLVYQIPYEEIWNIHLNSMLEKKVEAVEEAVLSGEWSTAIWMYERPYRIQAFQSYAPLIADEDYWSLLGDIWTDSENLVYYQDGFKELFYPEGRDWSLRRNMMSDEDACYLEQMPDLLEVFRGYSHGNRYGWSWTFSPAKAKFFAERWKEMPEAHSPTIVRGEIRKVDVLAFIHESRSEAEVILDPDNLLSEEDFRAVIL
jgi:hypothetical protein